MVASDKGRTHDLRLWRTSEVRLVASCLCLADKGYRGIAKQHEMSITPRRNPSRQPLPQADKQANRALARLRIRVEHSICWLKRFRIFAERYLGDGDLASDCICSLAFSTTREVYSFGITNFDET